MRDTSARREKIISLLKEKGSVQVHDLSKLFNISSVSIRKDLKFLDQRGIATRVYGGAFLNTMNGETTETSVAIKQKKNVNKKCNLALAATRLIKTGDSIILDSGTTNSQIALLLKNIDNITAITNDLNIIDIIARFDETELIVLGGKLRRKSMFFHGNQAEKTLKDLHADKLFLGVDGFHMEKGITTHFESEATLNATMCNAVTEVIVVTDSSKFDKICLHKICDISNITTLITDSGMTNTYREGLISLGIEVIVVDKN